MIKNFSIRRHLLGHLPKLQKNQDVQVVPTVVVIVKLFVLVSLSAPNDPPLQRLEVHLGHDPSLEKGRVGLQVLAHHLFSHPFACKKEEPRHISLPFESQKSYRGKKITNEGVQHVALPPKGTRAWGVKPPGTGFQPKRTAAKMDKSPHRKTVPNHYSTGLRGNLPLTLKGRETPSNL